MPFSECRHVFEPTLRQAALDKGRPAGRVPVSGLTDDFGGDRGQSCDSEPLWLFKD